MRRTTRRGFLTRAGLVTVGVAGLITGCSTPGPVTPTGAATRVPTPTTPAAAGAAPPPASASASPAATPASPTATAFVASIPDIAVARDGSPAAATRAAVEALGGIERFVRPGQSVLIKPNICTSQRPEFAATTNPEVVATLVSLCREAGAGRVLVIDSPFAGVNTAYRVSGIEEAVKAAGGEMEMMSRLKYRPTPIPEGRDIDSWNVYSDALDFDVFINVPIAKHHNLARLTLGMKNLLGVVDNRGGFHRNLGQRVADLSSVVRPDLVVIDAVRILTRNGPTGGNLDDVKRLDTVVASADPVAADAYAATFFGLRGEDLAYVRAGAAMGLGVMDLSRLDVAELPL